MNIIELDMRFYGKTKGRKEFLKCLALDLGEFLGPCFDGHENGAIMFFREMIKNIYDHADGKGRARFAKEATGIRFRIEDFGTGSHDFFALRRGGSSKAGNGINSGKGLGLIEDMATDLHIREWNIDCSKGFAYSGLYPYANTPA
ncbi:MAG: hypothetical protein WC763_03980 [Candidatus Paceibacterota bacterium]|jgi:hypothetical protein